MRTRRTPTEHRGERPAVAARAQAPSAAAVMALQRGAGNAAVARMLQDRAAVAREPAPAVEEPEKRYDFEITIDQRPLKFQQLTPEQTVASLRSAWRLAHNMLDAGRAETQRLVERREKQRTAVFWSDLFGGVEVPDPEMWNDVGGTLQGVLQVLDSTDASLQEHWAAGEAMISRGLAPGLESNPYIKQAMAFDATHERIKRATAVLERAGAELRECQRRLDEYVEGSIKGGGRAISGIKVSIVVLEAGAGGAGAGFAKGGGLAAQAGAAAVTTGVLGGAEETFNQVGEMSIGARDEFDLARIAKRGTKDVVVGFIGGVIGGKFAQVLSARLGRWTAGLSDELLAAHGLTRDQLTSDGQRLFVDWISGSVVSSPFATASSVLLDRAIEGRWKVKDFGDFAGLVFDDMVQSAALGGFLTYAGHAVNPSATSGRTRATTGEESGSLGVHEEGVIAAIRRAGDSQEAAPAKPKAPVPEKEALHDPERKLHGSADAVRNAVAEALTKLHAKTTDAANRRVVPPEIDGLIAEIAKTDPEFALDVRRYYDAMANPEFLEQAMVDLWERARMNQRTVAEELEVSLGGENPLKNEFVNTPGLEPRDAIAEFQRVLADPRMLIDVTFAADFHGSHTHAFQQYLGDLVLGPGGGLRFRQKLAALNGPGVLKRAGTDGEFEQPFWSRVWDEMFDSFGDIHSAEEIGKILQQHLDFPRWVPTT